jgi:sulfate adenylyltransferase large subunit
MATMAAFDIDNFIEQENRKDLLRFTTAGSVDDGKSTLIGRLLFDSRSVYEDQLRAVRRVSLDRGAGQPDLSLLTDGLRAEREQGITIDVAYRYFSTARRKFILADTPGHEQYTRNMVTGASTADLAIILVDARKGIQAQSRRHAYVAALLGIRYFIVAINKMDLAGYQEKTFLDIKAEFRQMLLMLNVPHSYFVPISALEGDNVVDSSDNMPWFYGPSLLEYLETIEIEDTRSELPFRFPVQRVVRPNQDYRGYAGKIASGMVRAGDQVLVLPSGKKTRVRRIVSYDGELRVAYPPMSVSLALEDEIDISRGDLICFAGEEPPKVASRFFATLVWFNDDPLKLGKTYFLKHTTRTVKVEVRALKHRVNINTFEQEPATALQLNEIGVAEIEASSPLYFDPYRQNTVTGSLVLIDPATNATIAAGMILEVKSADVRPGQNLQAQSLQAHINPTQVVQAVSQQVTPSERFLRYGHFGAAVNLEHRPEVAYCLERMLFDQGAAVIVLNESNSHAASAFVLNGFLVLLVAPQDLEGTLHPGILPENDEEAATAVYDLLIRTGTLVANGRRIRTL